MAENKKWSALDPQIFELIIVKPDIFTTVRRVEVLACILKGMSNKEIATSLGISKFTVKNLIFKMWDDLRELKPTSKKEISGNKNGMIWNLLADGILELRPVEKNGEV